VGTDRAAWQPGERRRRPLARPIAAALLEADAGDRDAERRLVATYRSDQGLHPGPTVLQASPFGGDPIPVALQRS
jgi:hypothetical protein